MIGYVRVSTGEQVEGASLENQEEKIRGYCKLHDVELAGVKVEVQSASKNRTDARPMLSECLAMIQKGEVNGLVVWNLDRFARSVRDVSLMVEEYFRDGGTQLVSVTENIDTTTAAGRLVINFLASVHQWEAERIGERVQASMRYLADQGYWTGGNVPYGWCVEPQKYSPDGDKLRRRIVPELDEQRVIQRARDLYYSGKSLRRVADALTLEGFRTRSGKPFVAGSLLQTILEPDDQAAAG